MGEQSPWCIILALCGGRRPRDDQTSNYARAYLMFIGGGNIWHFSGLWVALHTLQGLNTRYRESSSLVRSKSRCWVLILLQINHGGVTRTRAEDETSVGELPDGFLEQTTETDDVQGGIEVSHDQSSRTSHLQ